MGKPHQIALDLRRSSPNEQWGFSLVGGADVKTPLIVTRVSDILISRILGKNSVKAVL